MTLFLSKRVSASKFKFLIHLTYFLSASLKEKRPISFLVKKKLNYILMQQAQISENYAYQQKEDKPGVCFKCV